MDYDFSSLKDLYLRVEPALTAKRSELKRFGYSNIKNIDIWNCLIETKWKNGNGLMLSDIVDDILNTDCKVINDYANEKKNKNNDTSLYDTREVI